MSTATLASTRFGILRSDLAIKIVSGLLILGLWEVGTRLFAAPFVARPSGVVLVFAKVVSDAGFWAAAWSSVHAILSGLAIALVLGTLIGVIIGRVKTADRMLGFYVNACFTTPMIAVLPLVAVWFGYDNAARLATIVFAALFSVILNVSDGARSVPLEYLEVGRAYRAKRRQLWFDITLMSALPYLIAGARLAAGRALIGTVLAEIYVSLPGMGMFILANARGLKQNEAVVGVLLMCLLGLTIEGTMNWILRRWFRWYRREEREA